MQNALFALTPLGRKAVRLYVVAIGVVAVGAMLYHAVKTRSSGPFRAYTEGIAHSEFIRNTAGDVRKVSFFLNQVEYQESIFYMASVAGSKRQLNVLGKVVRQNGRWQLASLEEDRGRFQRLQQTPDH